MQGMRKATLHTKKRGSVCSQSSRCALQNKVGRKCIISDKREVIAVLVPCRT